MIVATGSGSGQSDHVQEPLTVPAVTVERGDAHVLEPTGRDADGIEPGLEPGQLRVRDEPARRRAAHVVELASVDHLERVAEALAALLLHLDEAQDATTTHDEIELGTTD